MSKDLTKPLLENDNSGLLSRRNTNTKQKSYIVEQADSEIVQEYTDRLSVLFDRIQKLGLVTEINNDDIRTAFPIDDLLESKETKEDTEYKQKRAKALKAYAFILESIVFGLQKPNEEGFWTKIREICGEKFTINNVALNTYRTTVTLPAVVIPIVSLIDSYAKAGEMPDNSFYNKLAIATASIGTVLGVPTQILSDKTKRTALQKLAQSTLDDFLSGKNIIDVLKWEKEPLLSSLINYDSECSLINKLASVTLPSELVGELEKISNSILKKALSKTSISFNHKLDIMPLLINIMGIVTSNRFVSYPDISMIKTFTAYSAASTLLFDKIHTKSQKSDFNSKTFLFDINTVLEAFEPVIQELEKGTFKEVFENYSKEMQERATVSGKTTNQQSNQQGTNV